MCVCACVWVVNYEGWSNKLRLWFLLPFLFIICCWRERKTADKIWPSASDWLWVHKASSGFNFSWGGSPRSRCQSRSRSCRPRLRCSRSSCDKNVTVSVKKPKDLLYFTLISSAQDLQNITTSPPRALSSFFFLFFRLPFFLFFGNGLWWSFVYVRLSSSNICFRDR